MNELLSESQNHKTALFGLVAPAAAHSTEAEGNEEFWDDGEDARVDARKKLSADRQSSAVQASLSTLLSASFQERAQDLQPKELDAFLIDTLKESDNFSNASPSVLRTAAGYLKQVLGTLHGLDTDSPDSDTQSLPDQALSAFHPSNTSTDTAAEDTQHDHSHRYHTEPVPTSAPSHSLGQASAEHQDPSHAEQTQTQAEGGDQHAQNDSYDAPAWKASYPYPPPPAFDHSQQPQAAGTQQQTLHNSSEHNAMHTLPASMQQQSSNADQQHPMDPYSAFLTAAASAATAAAAAFAGSWPRTHPPSQPPLPQSWLSLLPAPPQHHQQHTPPTHALPHNTHKHGSPGSSDTSSAKNSSGKNSDAVQRSGSSSPEPQPQALDARMAAAAASHMLHDNNNNSVPAHTLHDNNNNSNGPVHVMHDSNGQTAFHVMQHNSSSAGHTDWDHSGRAYAPQAQGFMPYPSSSTVRVIKLDEGPRIKARVSPTHNSTRLPGPQFQAFQDLHPPTQGAHQPAQGAYPPTQGAHQPLPLPLQDPLSPPSPYSSLTASPLSHTQAHTQPDPHSLFNPLNPHTHTAAASSKLPPHFLAPSSPYHHISAPFSVDDSDDVPQPRPPTTLTHTPSHTPSKANGFTPHSPSHYARPLHNPTITTTAAAAATTAAAATNAPSHAPSLPSNTNTNTTQLPQNNNSLLQVQQLVKQQQAQTAQAQQQRQQRQQQQQQQQRPHLLQQQPVSTPAFLQGQPVTANSNSDAPPRVTNANSSAPPRQTVPLPEELQGSVQRTLDFLENPFCFAPGAQDSRGRAPYPPRITNVAAERAAAEKLLEELLGGRIDYSQLAADLEAIKKRTLGVPPSSSSEQTAAGNGALLSPRVRAGPAAASSVAAGGHTTTSAVSAKAAANAEARGGGTLGKLVQEGMHKSAAASKEASAAARGKAAPRSSALPTPATSATIGGDIVHAVPPMSNVWDTEEAWTDLDTYVKTIQQEVAYRASAPDPSTNTNPMTPQQRSAAAAARLHRGANPSAARAAAAKSTTNTAADGNTSIQGGVSVTGGRSAAVTSNADAAKRVNGTDGKAAGAAAQQKRPLTQTGTEAGSPSNTSNTKPRTHSPPQQRPRGPAVKIAFGSRVGDSPPATAESAHRPSTTTQSNKTTSTAPTKAPTRPTHTLFYHSSTPPRGAAKKGQDPSSNNTSTASKLSALLRAHAQHAHAHGHYPKTTGHHHTMHHTTGQKHTTHTAVSPNRRPAAGKDSRGYQQYSEGSSGTAGSDTDASSRRSWEGSVSGASSQAADLGDVLSALASVLAEEDGVEAQEALMEELLEALQLPSGVGTPQKAGGKKGGVAGSPGVKAGGSAHTQQQSQQGQSQQQSQSQQHPQSSQQQQQPPQKQPQQTGGQGASTFELAQQLASLAQEQQQLLQQRQQPQQQQQQQQSQHSSAAGVSATGQNSAFPPSQAPIAITSLTGPTPPSPRFMAVQDTHTPPSAHTAHAPHHLRHPSQQGFQSLMQPSHMRSPHSQMQPSSHMLPHVQPLSPHSQMQQPPHTGTAPTAAHTTQAVHSMPPVAAHASTAPSIPPSAHTHAAAHTRAAAHTQAAHEEDEDENSTATTVLPATIPPPFSRDAVLLGLYGDAAQLGATGHAPAHAGAVTHVHDATPAKQGPELRSWRELGQNWEKRSSSLSAEALFDLVVEEVATQVGLREHLNSSATSYQLQQPHTIETRAVPLLTEPEQARQLAADVVREHLSMVLAPLSTDKPSLPSEPASPAPVTAQQPVPASVSDQGNTSTPAKSALDISRMQAWEAGRTALLAAAAATNTHTQTHAHTGNTSTPAKSALDISRMQAWEAGRTALLAAASATNTRTQTHAHTGNTSTPAKSALDISRMQAWEAGHAALLAAAAATAATLLSPRKRLQLQGLGRGEQQVQVQKQVQQEEGQPQAPQQEQQHTQEEQQQQTQQSQQQQSEQATGADSQQGGVSGVGGSQAVNESGSEMEKVGVQELSAGEKGGSADNSSQKKGAGVTADEGDAQGAGVVETAQVQQAPAESSSVPGNEKEPRTPSEPTTTGVPSPAQEQAQPSATVVDADAFGTAVLSVMGVAARSERHSRSSSQSSHHSETGSDKHKHSIGSSPSHHSEKAPVIAPGGESPQSTRSTPLAQAPVPMQLGGNILTMQVPVPIPAPYSAYHNFNPYPLPTNGWPMGTAALPPQSPQNPTGVHEATYAVPGLNQAPSFLQPQQEPQQQAQPASRFQQVPHQPHHQHQWSTQDAPAMRSRLAKMLPGLEKVLLDSSDLGSSGDSEALEDAVRSALHARGHRGPDTEQNKSGHTAGAVRDYTAVNHKLRGSYPEASLEALLAAVPLPPQQFLQAEQQRQQQPSQAEQQGQGVGSQPFSQAEQQRQKGKKGVHSSQEGGVRQVSEQAQSTQPSPIPPAQSSEPGEGEKGDRNDKGGAASSSGSELGAVAARLNQGAAAAGGDEFSSSVQESSELEWGGFGLESSGEAEREKEAGVGSKNAEKGAHKPSEMETQQSHHTQSTQSMAQQQQQHSHQQSPHTPPSQRTHTPSHPPQMMHDSGGSAHTSSAQHTPAQHTPSWRVLAAGGLHSALQLPADLNSPARVPTASPSYAHPPPDHTTGLPYAHPTASPSYAFLNASPISSVNVPPVPPATGATTGRPPSLQNYTGPTKRLWRPNPAEAPPLTGSLRLSGQGNPFTSDASPVSSPYSSTDLQRVLRGRSSTTDTSSSASSLSMLAPLPGGEFRDTPGNQGVQSSPQAQQQAPRNPLSEGPSGQATGASYRMMQRYRTRREAMMRELGLSSDSLLGKLGGASSDGLSSGGINDQGKRDMSSTSSELSSSANGSISM